MPPPIPLSGAASWYSNGSQPGSRRSSAKRGRMAWHAASVDVAAAIPAWASPTNARTSGVSRTNSPAIDQGLTDRLPARRDDEPTPSEVRDVLALDLARLRVLFEVVERMLSVGDLEGSVLPLCRPQELGVNAPSCPGNALGQGRRPGLRAGARAAAAPRPIPREQVEDASSAVEQDLAVARGVSGDRDGLRRSGPAGPGGRSRRPGREHGGSEHERGGQQRGSAGPPPSDPRHRSSPTVWLSEGTSEVCVSSPSYGDVAGVAGCEHRLVRGEQVRRHAGVEGDEVDLPAATVVRTVARGDAGDPELA